MTLDTLFQAIAAKFADERAARIAATERIGALLAEYRESTDAALMERYAAPYGLALPPRARRAGEVALELWECVRALPEIAEAEGRDPAEALASIAPSVPATPAVAPTPRASAVSTPPAYPHIRRLGRPVLLYGGTPEPAKERWLAAQCGAAEWLGGDVGVDGLASRIKSGKYGVVLVASALIGHGEIKKVVEAAKIAGVPYESVEKAGQGVLTKALDAIEARLD